MRLAALKDLVDRQLILQEFRKMQEKGANIPDYVVDDRVQTIIREMSSEIARVNKNSTNR